MFFIISNAFSPASAKESPTTTIFQPFQHNRKKHFQDMSMSRPHFMKRGNVSARNKNDQSKPLGNPLISHWCQQLELSGTHLVPVLRAWATVSKTSELFQVFAKQTPSRSTSYAATPTLKCWNASWIPAEQICKYPSSAQVVLGLEKKLGPWGFGPRPSWLPPASSPGSAQLALR